MSNDLSDIKTGKKAVFMTGLEPVVDPLDLSKRSKKAKKRKDFTRGSGIVDPTVT